MATPHSYTYRADQRAQEHETLILQLAEDGSIDGPEIPVLLESVRELRKFTGAAHCTSAVARAVDRVTNARTLLDLTKMAQAAIDELPESAA